MAYITQVGIMLAGCFIFYKLLLQKETFFRANRWILLVCLALSFSLPLIRVPEQWSFRKAPAVITVEQTETTLPADPDAPAQQEPASTSTHTTPVTNTTITPVTKTSTITWQQALTWAGWLYWFGVIIFGVNFLLQVITLLYRAYTRPVIRDGRFRIVELAGDKAPCSFLNNIFINPEKYDWDTYSQILLHEKIHIEQRHSLDLLLAEMVIIFQWFNPFAWQYRKALENNLEYLTDDQLLHHPQVERESYQMSLFKVSAPQFPLHLTTNYNQSLLKKRIAMMNVKKSNLHTAWKYGFLLPVLVLLVCLLNEPAAIAHEPVANNKTTHETGFDEMATEGVWFATIKDDKVNIQFKSDDDDQSTNSTTFSLSDLGALPRDKAGIFTVTREAGSIEFTGKFEGDQGMGRYKFTANKDYAEAIRKEGIELRNDKDVMVFFFVNVSRSYVKMLKDNGYTELSRNDVIPLAALKVDGPWIQSMKNSGIKELSLKNLIPLKALHIDGAYVADIRKAGYPDVTANQLISFKSQGIDGKYIADVRSAAGITKPSPAKTNKPNAEKAEVKEKSEPKERQERTERQESDDISANDIIAIKALHIDAAYIQSIKEAGFDNLSNRELIPFKAQGITGDYIKDLKAIFKDLSAHDVIAIKAQHITPEYAKSFESLGFSNISAHQIIPLKSLGVTPEYIKGFQDAGYKDITLQNAVAMKAQRITPELAKEYSKLGFENLSLNELISAKVTGTTPDFINSMKAKGHNLKSINKYIQLKNLVD